MDHGCVTGDISFELLLLACIFLFISFTLWSVWCSREVELLNQDAWLKLLPILFLVFLVIFGLDDIEYKLIYGLNCSLRYSDRKLRFLRNGHLSSDTLNIFCYELWYNGMSGWWTVFIIHLPVSVILRYNLKTTWFWTSVDIFFCLWMTKSGIHFFGILVVKPSSAAWLWVILLREIYVSRTSDWLRPRECTNSGDAWQ